MQQKSGVAQIAANNTFDSETKINKAYILSYLEDTKNVFTSPFYATRKSLFKASVTLALSGTAFLFDAEINSFAQRNRAQITDHISSNVLEHLADGFYSIPINFCIVGTGYLSKDIKLKSAGLQTLKAMAISSLVVIIPKYVFQRHRPFEDSPSNNLRFEGPLGNFRHTSFPSGHTCSAFTIAAVYSEYYKETMYVPVIAYSLATLAGISRMNDNKHWASDVLIGAALGYGIGKLIAKTALRKKNVRILPRE